MQQTTPGLLEGFHSEPGWPLANLSGRDKDHTQFSSIDWLTSQGVLDCALAEDDRYSDRLVSQDLVCGLRRTLMAKRREVGDLETRPSIIDATVALLRERRTGDVTTEEIARRAGCAKGLVHYHFRGKPQLLVGAAERLWNARSTAWTEALGMGDPQAAISAGWRLVTAEAADGTGAACAAIGLGNDELVVRSVSASRRAFASALTGATSTLLGRMGLAPSVPASELGTLLAATIEGIALQLGSGAESDELEQAWAAFWVGLLALTRPRRA